jgi:Glycosyl transferase family 11
VKNEMSDLYITNLLLGGLGNQLFQIAAGWSLSKRIGFKYVLGKTNFIPVDGQGNNLPRYENNIYKKIPICDSLPSPVENYNERHFSYYGIYKDLCSPNTSICLNGYFQSELNFIEHAKEIKALFTPSEGPAAWLMENTNHFSNYPELFEEEHGFTFIGIRRGDYLKKSNIHNPCGMTYYTKAIQVAPSQRYYIASDDIEWAKQNFIGPQFVFFEISRENDIEQFYLMMLFQKFIISNSSFYWWGSYLSIHDEPFVVAPDKWISWGHDPEIWKRMMIYRDDMIVLERPIEV